MLTVWLAMCSQNLFSHSMSIFAYCVCVSVSVLFPYTFSLCRYYIWIFIVIWWKRAANQVGVSRSLVKRRCGKKHLHSLFRVVVPVHADSATLHIQLKCILVQFILSHLKCIEQLFSFILKESIFSTISYKVENASLTFSGKVRFLSEAPFNVGCARLRHKSTVRFMAFGAHAKTRRPKILLMMI